MKKIFPYLDKIVVLLVRGDKLLTILENSVSLYPRHEGRFLQISGIRFKFDPSKPSGSRVDPKFVEIVEHNELLNLEKDYRLATITYLKLGKEGYDVLADCHEIVDEENLPDLFSVIVNHFKSIEDMKNGPRRFRY